jgi:transposase-like protein
MVKSKRSGTPSKYIYHVSYLYFSGLSFRKTSEHHLLPFVKRNYFSIWNWIQQRYKPTNLWKKRRKASGFIVDETIIRVGGRELVCLVIACN